MNYTRILVVAVICVLINTIIQDEVNGFYPHHSSNRRRRRNRQLVRNERLIILKNQQRGENLKVWIG